MTEQKTPLHEIDAAIQKRILERTKAVNEKLVARLSTVAEDLEAGAHRAALGGLDRLERRIYTMRNLLFLLN